MNKMDSNRKSEETLAKAKKKFSNESIRKSDKNVTKELIKVDVGSSKVKPNHDFDFSKSFVQDLLPFSKSEETTGEFLKEIHEMMLQYIFKTYSRKSKILDFHHPHQLFQGIEGFSLELTGKPESLEQVLVDCRDTLKYGVKTGHPRFFNQLSSGLDIVSLAAEWTTATANTNMFTYEIAPVFVLMEEVVLKRMRQIVGWIDGDGIFSPGGTINNLYAVMLARHQVFPSVKDDGLFQVPQLVMFQSRHAHYSNKRPASILGIGSRNCIDVEVDSSGAMIPEDLENKIIEALQSGKQPFYVTATSGTTVKGAFDPLRKISELCQRFNIWLHVDGAWGAAVLMSRKHRHLMDGVELADSITWNPHKMMGVVLQCSALLIKKKGALENCNSMRASYLFQQDKHYDVTFDTGDKTIQCGRHVDVFKFWLAWRAKGDEGFEKHVDKCIDLSRYLVEKIKKTPGFKLVFDNPQFTNVCFWYFPPRIRSIANKQLQEQKLAKVAPLIKSRMMENGTLMVGYQPLDNTVNFFRNVISNPAVTEVDVDFIVEEIERLGHDLDP